MLPTRRRSAATLKGNTPSPYSSALSRSHSARCVCLEVWMLLGDFSSLVTAQGVSHGRVSPAQASSSLEL